VPIGGAGSSKSWLGVLKEHERIVELLPFACQAEIAWVVRSHGTKGESLKASRASALIGNDNIRKCRLKTFVVFRAREEDDLIRCGNLKLPLQEP